MQPNISYPPWLHACRGFVIGLIVGCGGTTVAYESHWITVGDAFWKQIYFPLVLNGVPWLVLAVFEIYFGVRRYRALRREMDARTGLNR